LQTGRSRDDGAIPEGWVNSNNGGYFNREVEDQLMHLRLAHGPRVGPDDLI
jgi:hypothetical protein